MGQDPYILKAENYFQAGDLPLLAIRDDHHKATGLHHHDFFEFVFLSRGVALHSHEGRTQVLTSGDAFLILPGETHSYLGNQEAGLYNCLFTREAFSGLEGDLAGLEPLACLLDGGRRGSFERVHAEMAERQEFILALEQIVWERLNRPVGWQLKCKALLLGIFVVYLRLACSQRNVQSENLANYRRILKAVAFLERSYEREVTVEETAREAGMSVGYLSRQFKAFLGTSPSEYARNFRIAKAAELLRQEEKSVKEIAHALGFGDSALFSRQFHQVTGVTPTEFRRNR